MPRLRAFELYYGRNGPLLLAVRRVPAVDARHRPGWRDASRVRARALHARVLATAAAGARRGRARRLHLLQHQRAEPLRHRDAMQRAGRLREEVQALAARRSRRSRRSTRPSTLSARAARADARHFDLANRNAVPVRRATCSSCRASARVHQLAFAAGATPTTATSAWAAQLQARDAARAGATSRSTSTSSVRRAGFRNSGSTTDVVYNGSFVNVMSVLPVIGYDERGRAVLDRDRPQVRASPEGADAPARTIRRARDESTSPTMRTGSRSAPRSPPRPTSGRSRPATSSASGSTATAPLHLRDGRADPRLLRRAVGALRGQARPLERRGDRGLLPARATSTTSTA
jgi:hypothetical protein